MLPCYFWFNSSVAGVTYTHFKKVLLTQMHFMYRIWWQVTMSSISEFKIIVILFSLKAKKKQSPYSVFSFFVFFWDELTLWNFSTPKICRQHISKIIPQCKNMLLLKQSSIFSNKNFFSLSTESKLWHCSSAFFFVVIRYLFCPSHMKLFSYINYNKWEGRRRTTLYCLQIVLG